MKLLSKIRASVPAYIETLDAADVLAGQREKFVLPEEGIYLDGNSLGPAPRAVFDELDTAIRDEWAKGLIASWNDAGWFALPATLGDRIAPLLGAQSGQVVVTDSTTVNLYKALWAARELNPSRSTLLVEANCFPTDIYISDSVAKQFGTAGVQKIDSGEDALQEALGSDVAVCLLNAVDYRTGRMRDIEADTARVRSSGAVVVWDLSHATGVVPLELDRWEVDFAVGCTYKYLNGGPGAPAFIYAARKHHESMQQPLQGWWGHSRPFDFTSDFDAPPNIARMLCGTQGILSMRSIGASLDIFDEVRLHDIRHKSVELTDLFMRLLDPLCDTVGMRISTPRDADSRGSQVALNHPEAYALVQAMIEHGVVGDFRAPDTLRFGFAPLYLRYSDVWCAAELLREVFEQSLWQAHKAQDRKAVT